MSVSIWQKRFACLLLSLVLCLCGMFLGASPALAGLKDDHFDGNIFPLYAGNGSLVPPRVSLAEARKAERPALLMFYLDDSSDCKQYVSVISQLDAFYGRAAAIIPVNVDAISARAAQNPLEPGYYYQGFVPQTVVLDASGKVVLNQKGNLAYEQVDDVLRQVFDLLPRSESVELKRRQFNEFNSELVEPSQK